MSENVPDDPADANESERSIAERDAQPRVSPSPPAENDGTVNKIDKAEAPETALLELCAADDGSSARARAIAALASRSDVIPSWTREEIERAELGDIITAAEFGTEFLQALDLSYYDYELDGCVLPAFRAYIESAEFGQMHAGGQLPPGVEADFPQSPRPCEVRAGPPACLAAAFGNYPGRNREPGPLHFDPPGRTGTRPGG